MGHQGCQTVIVTEAHLRRRDRVILVDDRDSLELAQSVDGALGVAGTVTAGRIGGGEQNLADRPAVTGETAGPLLGEQHLAGRGARLFGRQVGRLLGQPQRAHTAGHRTGGHHDHVGVAVHAGLEGIGDDVDTLRADQSGFIGETGRTDLHDNALGGPDRGADIRTVPVLRVLLTGLGIRELLGRGGDDRTGLMHRVRPELQRGGVLEHGRRIGLAFSRGAGVTGGRRGISCVGHALHYYLPTDPIAIELE